MADLRWAPPTREDDADWVDLLAAIEAVDHFGEVYAADDIDDEWESLTAHPETDSVFVWDGPQLVGFGWLKTQVGTVKEHTLGLWGGVRPSHRRQGIGTDLLQWQMGRAREVAAGLDAAQPAKLRLDLLEGQADRVALAERAGLEPVRTFLDMGRSTSTAAPAPVDPVAGLSLVDWSPDRDEAARQAHGDAFLDHWGSEPRGPEEWRHWYTGHRGFRPDLSVLAIDGATDLVAGLVLCAAYPADWENGAAPVEAWITSVATRRPWRGKGVAAWLLTEVLGRIAESDTGFERAILGVDSENPTGAVRVYERLGFRPVRAAVTYAARL